jgi:hypothetical protein
VLVVVTQLSQWQLVSHEISLSDSSEYDGNIDVWKKAPCSQSIWSRPTFQRCVLSPSSVRSARLSLYPPLKRRCILQGLWTVFVWKNVFKQFVSISYLLIALTYISPPEAGVGLVPWRGCLLTLAYYVFHRWYEFGERRWSDILTGENRRIRRKTWPSSTSSTTNPTWIDQGANPGLRGERPATNNLSHGTAHLHILYTQWVNSPSSAFTY